MTDPISPLFTEPSNVSLTVTPSKAILAEIDNFCEFSKQSGGSSSREDALLFFALARAAAKPPGPLQAKETP